MEANAIDGTIYRTGTEDFLRQGDILLPSKMKEVLAGHQDYINDRDHFPRYIVLTQSCDLERENDRVNYVSLAVVRNFEESIGDMSSDATRNLIKAILQYEYNKRGYFFLPEEPALGIDRSMVADLRVTFSVHKKHYPNLVKARNGGLNEIFAIHLGNLIAQTFNRVALPSRASDIKAKIKDDYRRIQAKKKREFEELVAERGSICEVSGCDRKAEVYRYASSTGSAVMERPVILCRDHANQFDNGMIQDGL